MYDLRVLARENHIRFWLALFFAMTSPVFAADSELVGIWKLVSFQSLIDNEPPKDAMGANPKGYLILTREGRMVTLLTSSSRKPGLEDAERAALHKSLISYT